MQREITVVIADDHPVVRKGLRYVIERETEFRLLDEVEDGTAALEAIERHRPNVAVLDIEMPGLTGLQIVERVRAQKLPVAVILLTVYDDEGIFRKAMDLGVNGYLLKDSASLDIVRGIKRVAEGEYYISPSLTNKALNASAGSAAITERKLGLHLLTTSERRILQLIAAEKSSKEIADELHISIRTVDHHRNHISAKLNVRGSFSLLRFAMEHKAVI